MGEGWVSHHGKHKGEGARGIIETEHAAHPILKGVTDVFWTFRRLRYSQADRKGYHPHEGCGDCDARP